MNKKFISLLALIVCAEGCCERHTTTYFFSQDSLPLKSQNDFKIYAKDVHRIYFAFDKDEIKDESIPKMNELISQLKKVRNIRLIMYGYTDRVGQNNYNHQLAIRRINAVKKILIRSGVIKTNNISIETKALGESDPLISYNTINNNPNSRRVDVFIARHQ